MRSKRKFIKLVQYVLFHLIIVSLLFGCDLHANNSSYVTPTTVATPLPAPVLGVTPIPDVEAATRAFLDAWAREDYETMYSMLSIDSRAAIEEEQFIQRYDEVASESALIELLYDVFPAQITPKMADVPYQVTLRSAVVGEITRDMQMNMSLEDGQWRVEWHEGLILPELVGGNYILMQPDIPVRASIYDRNNNPLAAQTESVAIGLYPDYVDLADDQGLLGLLQVLTGIKSYKIAGMIEEAEPGEYLPLAEIAKDSDPRRLEILSSYGAVVISDYNARLYYNNGTGPHIVGYVSAIQEDELSEYRRRGYRSDERVGRDGLELWGEEILSGVRGGTLYVFNPDGKPIAQLGGVAGQPGQDIYTTLDREFQREAQRAMSIYSGAIVVLERDTGRVLALVSSPGFDQNAYEFQNYNWALLLEEIINNANSPLFNRATQGQYALGSVFKLVTLAAALESGIFTPESTYQCGYVFEELPGFPRYDWTYEHYQEDGVTRPSGLLTLSEGLIRSCNPYFWHIGLHLYQRGLTTAISDMARGYGLGSPTGIEVIEEEQGNIPDPQSEVDAINLAIGQGDSLVTPIQVARFVAALGNGGTLYRPQVIEKIVGASGLPTFEFQPEPQGVLPVSAENIQFIQEAMLGVVRSQLPVGTAYSAFTGLDINVAGKTGTAEVSGGADSHAWFVGYTFENRQDKPDIVVVVIAENAGEGSEIAAPIFRRIIELYYYGAPRKIYRWEAYFDVTASPTLPVTETPTFQIIP